MRHIPLKDPYQKGQVLLISLLVLVVAVTVGLSVATRSISTLRMTSAEDSSQRAFSAAEAGIEQALTATVNTTLTGNLTNNSAFTTSTSVLSGDNFLVNNGSFILKDDPVDVWLSSYPDYISPWTGTLSIYWGSSGDACVDKPETSNSMTALEVVLISGTKVAPVINHFAFDPCATRRNSYNNFSPVLAGGVIGGKSFAHSVNIPVSSGLLARVIPLYAGTRIGIAGTDLPPQGTIISSVGNSGGTQRKIVSFRGYPTAPIELYPFLIFAPK